MTMRKTSRNFSVNWWFSSWIAVLTSTTLNIYVFFCSVPRDFILIFFHGETLTILFMYTVFSVWGTLKMKGRIFVFVMLFSICHGILNLIVSAVIIVTYSCELDSNCGGREFQNVWVFDNKWTIAFSGVVGSVTSFSLLGYSMLTSFKCNKRTIMTKGDQRSLLRD